MRLSDMIDRFKNPSKQVTITKEKSSLFERAQAGVRGFVSRAGKVAENKPAIFDLKGWQAKNRSWLAGKTTGFEAWQAGNRANLEEKVDFVKTGIGAITGKLKLPQFTMPSLPGFPTFPKLPGLPDFGGWMQGKMENVSDVFGGFFERIGGVAADWKAKRDRKTLIRKIVLVMVLLFLGLLLWKKTK